MLFESLLKEANGLQIHQFDLQGEKVICHRDVKTLFGLKLIINYAFSTQSPWLYTHTHEYRICIGKVYYFVDKDEYFSPREPICVIHGRSDRLRWIDL